MDITINPTAGKSLTPQMPTEPTAEAKAMEFKMPDNMNSILGDTDSTITVDKKEIKTEQAEVKKEETQAAPKVEEKKVEPKVEEKKIEKKSVLKAPVEEKKVEGKDKVAETTQTQKPTVKPITPVKDAKKVEGEQDTFDYTKYAPTEVTNMKNMSRPSREAYAKLLDENKQLSSLKDSNYLQHEQGYTLSPEFNDLRQKDYFANTEAKCWEQALLAIKSGKPFKQITGWDKQGNPVMSQEIQPSDADEIRVANNLSMCINASTQIQGQLQQFPQRFQSQIKQDLQVIEQVQKEQFAWQQDPKLLDYSVHVEGKGDTKLRDIKSDFKSMWPAYQQNSKAVDVAADLFVAMQILKADLQEAQNGKQVAEIQKEEIQRAEPSSDSREITTAKSINGITDFKLNGDVAEKLGIRD